MGSTKEAIEKRIAEFLAARNPKLHSLEPAVREHGFLPLYIGWLATLGIRPDGSFVWWDDSNEIKHPCLKPLVSGYYQRLAICDGARKYPELRALLPDRPADAQTCEMCGGSGELPPAVPAICKCGGCGWIIPGESLGDNPG
jgi:hypothetical protein